MPDNPQETADEMRDTHADDDPDAHDHSRAPVGHRSRIGRAYERDAGDEKPQRPAPLERRELPHGGPIVVKSLIGTF
jgi:hypothetical protein